MANNDNTTWPADVKHAEGQIDPGVLPEYTLLPASPAQSVVSYNTANDDPEAARPTAPSALPSGANPNPNPNPNTNSAGAAAESLTIVKLLYMGVLALAVPPLLCALVGLVAGATALYGCGKLLEGTGRALALAPELAYRAWVAKRGRAFVQALGAAAHRERGNGREEEDGMVGEGQVALEDVEAGQGGPISI